MGKIVAAVLVIGLAVGGWFAYQKYFAPPSPAYLAYQQYAEALAREQYQKAEGLATGAAREKAASMRQGTAGSTLNLYGTSFEMRPPSIASIAGEVHSITWERQSESGDDARVTLVVNQTVCRIPPGVSSAMCKWHVEFRHEAEVVNEGGLWRVAAFSETRTTPQ